MRRVPTAMLGCGVKKKKTRIERFEMWVLGDLVISQYPDGAVFIITFASRPVLDLDRSIVVILVLDIRRKMHMFGPIHRSGSRMGTWTMKNGWSRWGC